jgi:hypothetical protein
MFKMNSFKKKIILLIPLLLIAVLAIADMDIFDKIAASLKNGNSKEVASFFDTSVELKTVDKTNVYSRNQAELVLKDFFDKHPVRNFTIIHRGTSAKGARYAIGNLETGQGTFRTYMYVKETAGNMTIQQLNIENQ